MWIWKKYNADETSTEKASDIAVFSARETRFVLGRTSLKQETLMRNWKNHKEVNVTKHKQQSSHKLTLMLRIFYWCFCLFLLAAL